MSRNKILAILYMLMHMTWICTQRFHLRTNIDFVIKYFKI
jgi:hypothetical protein